MELLERESYLTELESAFGGLSESGGSIVFISGEAGIGKTSLVEKFTQKIEDKANILWGACDALFTPRPLGPLYDIASQLNNGLLNLLNNRASRTEVFARFLKFIQERESPSIVIFEDVHWADESTLDLIKFLGRRISIINTLLIITFRDDEIGFGHPLRLVLGDIPTKNLIRYKIPPLTEKVVKELSVSYGIEDLFKITGGNPFLITELLNNKDERIPSTIKDSVLTRISRLTSKARDLVEFVSIIPTRTEKWILEGVMTLNSEILDECFNSNILRLEDGTISFRHELSRMAVEEFLSESKRQFLNEKILQILLKQDKKDKYLARIIHHAAKANNRDVIIKYAPDAARQASKLGAHILAANHYQNAMKFVDDLPVEKQIELYEGRAYECYLTGKIEEGIKAGEMVLSLLRKFPDPEREGENYRRLSRMLWYDCQDAKGEEYLDKAIEILGKLPVSKQLAMAYSNKSQIYMLREENEKAIRFGEKAVELARELNEEEIEAHSLNSIGCAKMFMDDYTGVNYLVNSLQLSLKNDFYEQVSRGYINLGSVLLQKRKLAEADEYFTVGTEYCNEKDLHVYSLCMAGHYANAKLYLGKWDEAVDIAGAVFKKENVPAGNTILPLYITGLIRARRGDPGALTLLDKSDSLALQIGEMDKIVVVKSGKAEALWLQNKLEDFIDDAASLYEGIKDGDNSWAIGQLAYWLWKGNRLQKIPGKIARPYLLQIKGEWESAAKLWGELQCPYEQALALSEGNEESMKRAVEIFHSLGASATSQLIKQKMRGAGIRRIPKGPRKSTRKNPAGLTTREIEVLNLLSNGLTNNEIGNQLFISSKTVDHHISAILSKLNIHSRYEAAAFVHSNRAGKK